MTRTDRLSPRQLALRASLTVLITTIVMVSAVGAAPWVISDATLETSKSYTQQSDWISMDVSDNGEWLYLYSLDAERLYRFDLTEPYNVSSGEDTATATDINIRDGGIRVKNDGSKLYHFRNNVTEYDLSTGYDITTKSQANVFQTQSTSEAGTGIAFGKDGERMYLTNQTEFLKQYNLSTPWDTSTATLNDTVDLGGDIDQNARNVVLNGSGDRLYVGESDGTIHQYNLSTPWEISSATHNSSVSANGVHGLDRNDDGLRFYTTDVSSTVYQYVLADAKVSGFVKDTDGDPVENAEVTVNTTAETDTTGADGSYELFLNDGGHEITATSQEGVSNSIEVTVSGSDLTNQNITLTGGLTLDVEPFMKHGTNQTYTVHDGQTEVTSSASVSSSNSTVITVNQPDELLEATSDTDINQEVTITAAYQDNQVTENVTVALQTAENADIMPTGLTMGVALVGNVPNPITDERPGGTQLTMQLIIIAALAAVAMTRAAGSYAGIGAIVLTMAGGWFMGWVGHGLMLVTIYIGLFIGLNVAANSGATLPSRPGR